MTYFNKKTTPIILLAILLFCSIFQGCGWKEPLPACSNPENCQLIKVAAGPEDFVLDRSAASPRLIISCQERRDDAKLGEIYSFDPVTRDVKKLNRTGDKDIIQFFRPHGIDIRYSDGQTLLYVILHDPHNSLSRFENAVAVYKVLDDTLEFVEPLLESKEFLWSPNDLSVLDNGELYLTNDYRNIWDLLFKRKVSEVVHYNPELKKWSKAASKLKVANGILSRKDKVFISTTMGGYLYSYHRNKDGSLGDGEVIIKIKGLDNIMPFGEKLIVTAHYNDFAFLKHQKSAASKSPTAIFLIDPAKKSSKEIYVDDGSQFSAASTAFIHNNTLYASQVFDPYLLVCDLPENME